MTIRSAFFRIRKEGNELQSRIGKSTIEEARAIDLLSFFLAICPEQVVRCGRNEFCLKEHDSLKMSNGKWFWWSRGIGGTNAIDYLMKAEGMDFISAVRKLTKEETAASSFKLAIQQKRDKQFLLPKHNFECTVARRYLLSRGIDRELIEELVDQHMIAEENKSHAVMFMGMDDDGTLKHCSIRSTDGSSVKWDAHGSDKKYSFRLLSSCKGSVIRVFESAIDLLSFATLLKQNGMNYHMFNLLSLSGIYGPGKDGTDYRAPPSVVRYLEDNPQTKKIILHLDNDVAGKAGADGMIEAYKDKYDVRYVPAPKGKDFNDYLMYVNSIHQVVKGLNDERKQKDKEI